MLHYSGTSSTSFNFIEDFGYYSPNNNIYVYDVRSYSQTKNVQKFNPALGTLTGVDVVVSGAGSAGPSVTWTVDPGSSTLSGAEGISDYYSTIGLSVSGPSGTEILASSVGSYGAHQYLDELPNYVDDLPSTVVDHIDVSDLDSFDIDGTDRSPFIGTGTFPVEFYFEWRQELSTDQDPTASTFGTYANIGEMVANYDVYYTYEPAQQMLMATNSVPEPSIAGLVTAAAFVTTRRWRLCK
ncbi:MAG: choice-of-anchor E domain-containing protein [Tepidisphaeraceae bacterium]